MGRIPGLRLDRAGVALTGAAMMMAAGAITPAEAYRAIDLDTLTLLLGMMIVVAHLKLSGFFRLVSGWALTHAHSPLVLIAAVAITTGALSAFLVNDAVCLVMTSIVIAWPLTARAQQPSKVPRVGILSPAASETAATLTAFRERIRDLGYIEGKTIALDFRLSNWNMDALPSLAAELVRIPVNVILTDTTSATLAAFDATRTIPIVMGATARDPIALGLAKSLARPGGNVTGTNFFNGLSEKRLQLLKLAFPAVQRVAVLGNPSTVNTASEMPKAEMAAAQLGVRLVPLIARTPAELRAFTPAALSGSDGLLVIAEGLFNYNRAAIIEVASIARVPAIYPEREYADDGGLIAYGPNVVEHFRQAAGYVDRILRGANPGDLPINASSKFDFVVNLRTARALGLTPSPEFLSTADQVIE